VDNRSLNFDILEYIELGIASSKYYDHIDFLNETTNFHEDIRLQLYPKIFENQPANTVNWQKYKPTFFESKSDFNVLKSSFYLILLSLILIGLGIFRNLKYFS